MTEKSDGSIDVLKPMVINDDPTKSIKSTAVVKYSASKTPALFAQLQCNTNLNQPPSNWLSSSAESYGLQSVWSQSTGFSSFRMAHMFPDCVGEVDVVSDAENIKKLLKLPYSHSTISMMVHRIENTILLDDFDIHKYLIKQAENDWQWLREFFYQHILQHSDKRLFHKTNSRNTLQQKNLISKFLYHSLVTVDNNKKKDIEPLPLKNLNYDPILPEPTNEDKLPDPNDDHNFTRNVVWTFENIQMLIGTDMPIFGGQTHPCISLRLRDMNKPINVLTGIDYWLDNLMCNVPEVIMCYHLDGIVQKYEFIKTEDLPNLDNGKFSPKVIRDVAQNILSFLKNNATKAGHTYWLFKGKDDDVVKLYDLTSLCSDISDDKKQNPFTIPVAMLLYRVARNMKYSSDCRGNQGTINMLLKNCIQLLNRENHPQIATSAHYMLSDLYVPADINPSSPVLDDLNDEENGQQQAEQQQQQKPMQKQQEESDKSSSSNSNDCEASATIKSFMLAHIKDEPEREESKYKPPTISGSIAERCQIALNHVAEGIECLKYFPIDEESDDEKKQKTDGGDNSTGEAKIFAKPFEAIPMPYAPLEENKKQQAEEASSPSQKKKLKKKKKLSKDNSKIVLDTSPKTLLCKAKTDALPTWQAPKKSDNLSWKSHLKTLLYEKASLIFSVLAEYEYTNERYGSSLRYIFSVLKCQKYLEIFCGVKNVKLIHCSFGRAGDCFFRTVQDWLNIDKHCDDYNNKDKTEEKLFEEMLNSEDVSIISEEEFFPEGLKSIESALLASNECYKRAMETECSDEDKKNLLKRLGNINNELGVFYMNSAVTKLQSDNDENSTSYINDNELLIKSLWHLESGIKAFDSIRDEANLALLHCNTGKLMRVHALLHSNNKLQEKYYYNKALISYQKALQVLGERKSNPGIWDSVSWDLSTTLFNMATSLQDFPNPGDKTEDEIEKEVIETLQKALKHCDTETQGSRQPVYQFRAATIQYRLGSLYHHIYRRVDPDVDTLKRKKSLHLSNLYYVKAAKLFLTLEQPVEYLRVQIERIALAEYQAETSTTFNGKLKANQNAIELIFQCESILKIIEDRYKTAVNKSDDKKRDGNLIKDENLNDEKSTDVFKQNEEEEKLVILLKERFQYILKSLTKLCLGKTNTANNKKECEKLANLYKNCYSKALRFEKLSGLELIEHMISLIQEYSHEINEIQDFY